MLLDIETLFDIMCDSGAVDEGIVTVVSKENDDSDLQTITLTYGYILREKGGRVWDMVCLSEGLNPWMINEGLASNDDTITLPINKAKELGVL